MSTRILHTVPIVALMLLGCDSSSQTGTDTDTGTGIDTAGTDNQLFLAGLFCQESESSTAQIDNGTASIPELDVNCANDADPALPGPGVANSGDGSFAINDGETAVTAATVDENRDENPLELVLYLHDGNTRSATTSDSAETDQGTMSATRIDWGLYGATLTFGATLFQANSSSFTGGSFEVLTPGTATPTDSNTANFVFFAQDSNANGTLDRNEELNSVVSGIINVSGESPNWSIDLNVTLEDGTELLGAYNGAFYQLPTL